MRADWSDREFSLLIYTGLNILIKVKGKERNSKQKRGNEGKRKGKKLEKKEGRGKGEMKFGLQNSRWGKFRILNIYTPVWLGKSKLLILQILPITRQR